MIKNNKAFTLLEVLLALAVIAIALTALFKATSQDISYTRQIKERTISHWIAKQGVNMIQLGLLNPKPGEHITETTIMLGERWYWRINITPTPVAHMQKIQITLSKNQSGPFISPLYAFRYAP